MNYESELKIAREAAALAGAIQQEARNGQLDIERKADASPVTEIDKRCEQVIFETIQQAFPNDGFLGEETGQHDGSSGRRWIVDPLDGTRPFIRGIPTYSALIALEDNNRPVVGVIELPALGITYWAAKGSGAFKNGTPIRVSETATPDQVTGSALGYIQQAGTPRADALLNLMRQWDYNYGFMDGYTYGLIAEGAIDVCINLLDKAWDCAAAACIVTEAGGHYTDLDGIPSIHSGGIIISNEHIHDATLTALNGDPDKL